MSIDRPFHLVWNIRFTTSDSPASRPERNSRVNSRRLERNGAKNGRKHLPLFLDATTSFLRAKSRRCVARPKAFVARYDANRYTISCIGVREAIVRARASHRRWRMYARRHSETFGAGSFFVRFSRNGEHRPSEIFRSSFPIPAATQNRGTTRSDRVYGVRITVHHPSHTDARTHTVKARNRATRKLRATR